MQRFACSNKVNVSNILMAAYGCKYDEIIRNGEDL